ncbi:hypothetical protein CXB51_003638 [Gossypium anomalum]|uniref:Galectin domain-containing protein n=1 Tax=Gossypium anomalum TaxID=47600 RepID=A0A8J5ZNE8_9ROSI|nr:hypothetical protein CXB51_003638 [Gossypium anomalum]
MSDTCLRMKLKIMLAKCSEEVRMKAETLHLKSCFHFSGFDHYENKLQHLMIQLCDRQNEEMVRWYSCCIFVYVAGLWICHALPNGVEAIKEAGSAWNSLMALVQEKKLGYANDNSSKKAKEKQCPHFLNKMNAKEPDKSDYKLRIPCGLTQGSSITIIGIPNGLLGDFCIDLTGEALPGEPDPPIILHYNVRLHGDKMTEDPDRCPPSTPDKNRKGRAKRIRIFFMFYFKLSCLFPVDELDQCIKLVSKNDNRTVSPHSHGSRKSSVGLQGVKYFPFKHGSLFVATLRVGSEGIQMTVDGKHITSFAYRETLEPWLVSEVRISGDLKLISVLASGLPTSEDSDLTVNLEALKAIPLSHQKPVDLFIGVFPTANNFKRRMAPRRTWMQYPEVRSGTVAVRFLVGLLYGETIVVKQYMFLIYGSRFMFSSHCCTHKALMILSQQNYIMLEVSGALQHKNQIVNEELWNEARTYGDIQLMPFVDYYSLLTWKTLAICTFGNSPHKQTEVFSAKFVMKTDDAFLRVGEVVASPSRISMTRGLLYGLINSDSQPHRT